MPCTKSPLCACLPDYPRIAPAGSHHHHEFPPPARAASTGLPIVQDHQSLAGRSRRHDDSRHLVDATIIEAPSSTKNKEQQRDPEMHQTKKGNQWHFGMKAHIAGRPPVGWCVATYRWCFGSGGDQACVRLRAPAPRRLRRSRVPVRRRGLLYRGIQCQQVGLLGNAFNGGQHTGDVIGMTAELGDDPSGPPTCWPGW